MASDPHLMIVRRLFSRLVFSIQIDLCLALKIISFWMWLEGNGYVDFIESINAFDDNQVWAIASTAKTFIEVLHLEPSNLVNRSVASNLFQERAVEGIVFYLNNFCYKALIDLIANAQVKELIHQISQAYQGHMAERLRRKKGLITNMIQSYLQTHRDHGEGTSSPSTQSPTCQVLQNIMEATPLSQSINHLVEILVTLSITEKRNDADKHPNQHSNIVRGGRILFITFSNGYPLTEDDLHDFFMRHYGDVEEICLEEPVEPSPPRYAVVIFFSRETLLRVLDGKKRIELLISGKRASGQNYLPMFNNKD